MKRNEIEKKATEILRDHNLLNIPIDPLKVAKALGIKVMNAVFSEQDKSGVVVKRGDNLSILLNSNESPARKRFTIAHEIGHSILHMKIEGDCDFIDEEENFRTKDTSESNKWTDDKRREWEANIFASALLMNEELIKKKWKEYKDSNMLAWLFQVSPQAMIVRLTQIGLLENLP